MKKIPYVDLYKLSDQYKRLIDQSSKKVVVVFTGSGISAESGIPTYRDMGGLWEQYDFMELASPMGWNKHPDVVLEFYNQRRKKAMEVEPNEGHKSIKRLESKYLTIIITQNVDSLHERAGMKNVLHLHGELSKVRSLMDPTLVYEIGGDAINIGDFCEKGGQLRPHIVWFGESVDNMSIAYDITARADYFIVVGTSLQVYPANDLIFRTSKKCKSYLVDTTKPDMINQTSDIKFIQAKASEGVPIVVEELLKD